MVGLHRLKGDDLFQETYGKTLWETRFWCKRSRQLTLFHCFFLNWYLSRHCWRNLQNIMRPGKSIMKATKNLMSRVKGERPCWTRRCEDANGCQIAALKNDMILLYTNNHSVSEVAIEQVLCINELHCLQQRIYLFVFRLACKQLVPQRI